MKTPIDIARVAVALYQDGRSCRAISKHLCVSDKSVHSWVSNAGLSRSRNLVTTDEVDRMLTAHAAGLGISEIASSLGRHSETVRQHLIRHGIHEPRVGRSTDPAKRAVHADNVLRRKIDRRQRQAEQLLYLPPEGAN